MARQRDELTQLLDKYGPALLRQVIDAALEGKRWALELLLTRLVSPLRGTYKPIRLGGKVADGAEALQTALEGVYRGEIAADVAQALAGTLAHQADLQRLAEVERRLDQLERLKAVAGGVSVGASDDETEAITRAFPGFDASRVRQALKKAKGDTNET